MSSKRLVLNFKETINQAVQTLCNGGLVAFPTETVYGLGADAMNTDATNRIYEVKKRPKNHPLIVHVSSIELAKKLVKSWPKKADDLANKFWPGPMTLVFKKNNVLPSCVTAGQNTVGIRIPSNKIALKLLSKFAKNGSGFVAAPSANLYGSLSNTSYKDVKKAIGKYLTDSDLLLKGDGALYGLESTIIDFSTDEIAILRPGSITRESVNKFLKINLQPNISKKNSPIVSGSLKKHYCPLTPLYIYEHEEIVKRLKKKLFQQNTHEKFFYWGSTLLPLKSLNLDQEIAPNNSNEYAKLLYTKLNYLDRKKYKSIFFEVLPNTPEWEAINNRLEKAKS